MNCVLNAFLLAVTSCGCTANEVIVVVVVVIFVVVVVVFDV